MPVSVEQLLEDFLAGMALLAHGVPGGEQVAGDGVVLNRIGLPAAATNTLHVLSPDASRADAERLLDSLGDLPFVIRARPGSPGWVAEVAADRDHRTTVSFPIMVHDDLGAFGEETEPAVVEVDPQDDELVARVQEAFTSGNGTPPGVFEPLVAARALEQDGYAGYAALEGDTVTAVGLRLQGPQGVGVFGIATPPPYRRKGLGAAVTRRVVAEGRRHGASYAYLGASPMGFGIYERMGFRTFETWTFYVPG